MAAPVAERLAAAHPGQVVGVGQDPEDRLGAFGASLGATFEMVSDAPAYPASARYGVEVVPTLVMVDGGRVTDVVESWDRDGYNRVEAGLAEGAGKVPAGVSEPGDGLPSFRPG